MITLKIFAISLFFLSACVPGMTKAQNRDSADIFKLLGFFLGDQEAVFLEGQNQNFFVSRLASDLIELRPSPADEKSFESRTSTVFFIGPNEVLARNFICSFEKRIGVLHSSCFAVPTENWVKLEEWKKTVLFSTLKAAKKSESPVLTFKGTKSL